jgi:hypothetical protein
MSMQVPRSVHVPITAGCVAVVVMLLAGLVPFLEGSGSAFRDIGSLVPERIPSQPVAAPRVALPEGGARCAHCGIVVSTERLAPVGDAPAMYQVTVRLADRSTRVFSDSNAPRWRPGERIVIIEGGNSPGN